MKNKEQPQGGAIRKILKSEITSLIGIIAVVFSFIMFFVVPQQRTATDIALIQQNIKKIEENHLTHLQGYAEEILNLKEESDKRQEQYLIDMKANSLEHTEILKNLERVITIVELQSSL